MTSERVMPNCNRDSLVCPAVRWAEKEIERLLAWQRARLETDDAALDEINLLRELLENARSNYVAGSGPDQEWDARRDEAIRRALA